MKARILLLRGGAIGDFILTLPALRMVREAFPDAHLEVLGYRHIVDLACRRGYADESRSIEYGPMATFFAKNAELPEALVSYFSGFQQIISWLFDPDQIFETNLRRAGVKNFINAYRRIDDSEHAARQLAAPLEALALYLEDHAAVVHPNEADWQNAKARLGSLAESPGPWVAIHPGSGSPRKNWPPERWVEFLSRSSDWLRGGTVFIVGGEADADVLNQFSRAQISCGVVRDWPLPELAAFLKRCRLFVGHDSGIGHLAGAVGTEALLLFGPTDPAVWAPANAGVRVLREDPLDALPVDKVLETVDRMLGGIEYET